MSTTDLALGHELAKIRALALAIEHELDSSRIGCARDLADVLSRARNLDLDRHLADIRELTNARIGMLEAFVYSKHVLALNLAFNRARDRVDALDRALARARALDRAPARARALDRTRARARARARDLADALAYIRTLDRSIPRRPVAAQRREVGRVMSLAGRLLAVAVRLLPTAERTRYAEEFRSELWEVAHAGGRRRAQLTYAGRQLMMAWCLRAELRVPQQRDAAS